MLWDIFAALVVVVAVGLVIWDSYLRGAGTGQGTVLAICGVLIILAAAWAIASEKAWGWAIAVAGLGVVAAGQRVRRTSGS